jgi:hypothetical protein
MPAQITKQRQACGLNQMSDRMYMSVICVQVVLLRKNVCSPPCCHVDSQSGAKVLLLLLG